MSDINKLTGNLPGLPSPVNPYVANSQTDNFDTSGLQPNQARDPHDPLLLTPPPAWRRDDSVDFGQHAGKKTKTKKRRKGKRKPKTKKYEVFA
jgi:hypothetical protein